MTNTHKTFSPKKQHRLPLYRRAWFLTLMTLILIAAIVLAIIFIVKPSDQRPAATNPGPNSSASDSSAQKITASSDPNAAESDPEVNPDQVIVQYEGENPNNAADLSGSISYVDHANGVLAVGTMIDQFLSDGTCELRATHSSGQVYSATSEIIPAGAATSACRELNVAAPAGAYALEIVLKSNNKQGIIKEEAEAWD